MSKVLINVKGLELSHNLSLNAKIIEQAGNTVFGFEGEESSQNYEQYSRSKELLTEALTNLLEHAEKLNKIVNK
jgi:anti-sigma regulatory factor (Ser/Thr protein kinase)